jgi:hypothetical protein
MKTSNYYVKGNQLTKVLSGKYGYYAQLNGNVSDKRMIELGFEIKSLNKEQVAKLTEDYRIEQNVLKQKIYDEKMLQRQEQVEICLNSEPIDIIANPHYGNGFTPVCQVANLSGSKMLEAYYGCAKGTAYVRNNKVVAYHYGYEQPINVPNNCEIFRVDFSCNEICFS